MRVLVFRILHNTDDFIVAAVAYIAHSQVLTDRIIVRKELTSESFVNDGNVPGSGRVTLIDDAPSQQARSDRLKITGADSIPGGRTILRQLSLDVHPFVRVIAAKWAVP